jgi:predicted permease
VADLLIVSIGATLLGIAAGGAAIFLLGIPRRAAGTFLQGLFRGNLVFVGLPVVVYAFAATDGGSASAESSALLVFGPMVVLYNVLGVLALLLGGAERAHSGIARKVARELMSNPILISCAAGLVFSLADIPLPMAIERGFAAIGQMALPLALLAIGGTLHTARIRGNLGFAACSALMKVALLPVFGFLLARLMELSPDHERIALILLACPTASASYVLARQLNGDEALASTIIVLSSVVTLPVMAVVLAVTA